MGKKEENKGKCDCGKELKEKEEKIAGLTADLQRLQAEFENYQKRVDKEKQDFMKYACAGVVCKMLPVLDSLDAAGDDKGVKLVKKQMVGILKQEGLEEVSCEGRFNPEVHEVMMKEKVDGKEEDEVVEVFQKGYSLNGKVLRSAKVKVSS